MDFPDPDEEFECMHADELDYLRDLENESFDDRIPIHTAGNSKKNSEVLAKPLCENENKRKLDSLFGDVLDISSDEECSSFSVKKYRVCTTNDEVLSDEMIMEKILAKRKERMDQEVSSSSENIQRKGCITRTVPPWPFIPATTNDGKRVYVRVLSEETFKAEVASCGNKWKVESGPRGKSLQLLSEPYSKLKEQAENLLERKKAEAERSTLQSSQCRKISADSTDLWVEKYRPKSYMELLSDEGTNRTLLSWIKLWDHVVFKTEIKKKRIRKEEPKFKLNKFQNNFQVRGDLAEELDEAGYPVKRIALLCGPPGLGKTTLAHVIGEQAGYNVVEINASDDRSPEAFRNKLEAATSMQAVVGSSPRPNCLVMDEIDGAPAPSIDVLLKVALGKESTKGKDKKANKKKTVLKRPIICICNDLYAPALRLLRQHALVIHFGSTPDSRLAHRLMEISKEQGIKTDVTTLFALCEKMQHDIRSCISFLYLYKAQNKPLRMMDVQNSSLGLKDSQKSAFDVWQEVFKVHREKGVNGTTGGGGFSTQTLNSPLLRFSELSLKKRMSRVLKAVQSFGDYDRLSQGVFENYLSVKQKESVLKEIAVGMECFEFFDVINGVVHSQQTFFLYPYLPYCFVKWHFLFADNSRPKLSYPRTGFEANTRYTNFNQTMSMLMDGLSPAIRCHHSRTNMYLDVLPPLLTIISPPLRSVSIELFNQREKGSFSHLVKTMIDYNLTYVQERTVDGVYVYNLDPNVEEFVTFPGAKPQYQLSYNTKQIIAREIKTEIMKRFECPMPITPNVPFTSSQAKDNLQKSSQTANHLQKLQPKAIKELPVKVAKDFFGREMPMDFKLDKRNMAAFVKSDIWYHFKEGYTNAVRRKVKIKDFL